MTTTPFEQQAKLTVALLGTPLVERAGRPVAFDTRKAVALLAYLAVTGQVQSRESLIALLWPEHDRTRGRGALRRTLSVLNSATGGECLIVDRHTIGLHPDRVSVDITSFHEKAADVRHGHPAERSCPRCIAALDAAAAIYRDDFLAGFALRDSPEYDAWQSFQADSLRRRLGEVLERLVRARTQAGQPRAALDEARRWLALDLLHEPAHAALMRLYAWSGQRSAALQQYRECVRILDRELGVAPLSRTTALNDAIRAGRLPPSGAPAVTPPAKDRPVPRAVHDLPLVGRGAELARLDAVLAAVGDSGRLVTVAGEAGIGKTRLIMALDAAVTRAGGRVDVTRSHEGEEGLAFGVLADLLRTAARASGAEALALPAAWAAEVGRLLPELRAPGRGGPEPAPLDSPGAQSRFYAALVATLARLLGTGALLVVEDLQWADESSVAVLAYLLRRLADFPVLVALSWRPGFQPSSTLRAAFAEGRRDNLVTSLELGPLSELAVGELAAASLPPRLATPEMIRRLFAETGGVPLFVTEYVDALRRVDRVPSEADWQLPGGVRDLLLARLSGLSETTGQVLAAAAVLGAEIDLAMLRVASGRGDDEVVAAVEEAGRRAVLVEVAGGGSYEFAHDGLRRLVLELTGLARRRLLHARAAEALMQRRDAYQLSASIAAHLRRAGREADSAEWSWRAAERAHALYAHTEALDHLAAATALGYPGPRVHQKTGDVLTILGRYPDALTAYERAAATCPPDDQLSLATVEHKLAEVHHRLGEWDVAASHLGAALELLGGDADPVAQARVLADLALVAHRRHDPATAERTAGQALLLATATGDDAALAQTLDVLGVLAAQRGDHAAAVAHLEGSLRHAARLADPGARVAALNNLALVHAAAGRPDDAVAVGREALQRGLEHGDLHRVAALHTNLADLLHAAGQGDEALEHLKEAARLFAGIDNERSRRPEIWKLAQW